MTERAITAPELARWMCNHGFSATFSVLEVFRDIESERKEEQGKAGRGDHPALPSSLTEHGDDTWLTLGELIRALEVTGYGVHARENAESWFRTVLTKVREPQWKHGDIVVSTGKGVYIRQDSGWKTLPDYRQVPNSYPIRPLKKIGEAL